MTCITIVNYDDAESQVELISEIIFIYITVVYLFILQVERISLHYPWEYFWLLLFQSYWCL